MSSTDKYQTGPQSIDQVVADLQRRVLALETQPRLQSAAIDAGGLTVKEGLIRVADNNGVIRAAFGKQLDGKYDIRVFDPTGDARIKMGLLDGGDYGFNVKENGQNIFHEVPFIYTAFVNTGETCSSSTYGDLATLGPQVNVAVGSSGRILIFATAQIQWTGSAGTTTLHDGRFDVAFSGANTRTPNEASDPLVGIIDDNLVTVGNNQHVMIMSVTAQATFEGLTPGVTTVTMKYRRAGGVTDDPQFFRRNLTVVRL